MPFKETCPVEERIAMFRAYDAGEFKVTELCQLDRKSTRLNSSHLGISYAVFCLKKKTEMKIATPAAGMVLIPIEVRSVGDFEAAFAAMMRERPDAVIVTTDPLHQFHVGRIIEFLANNRLPGMFGAKENVAAGGLMAYGPSVPDLFRRAATYAHRILQGTKPADLPVELPTKFDLAVNLRTAKALGLELLPTFIARADEVVE